MTMSRDAFPKPLENYKALDIFGRNVVTTERDEWKSHRKVTAPGFTEKNNVMVFKESIAQTDGMLRKWETLRAEGKPTVITASQDTQLLTLGIISRIGFGVRLLWPGDKPTSEDNISGEQFRSNEIPEGHTMSWANALTELLDNLVWVLVLPKWLISE